MRRLLVTLFLTLGLLGLAPAVTASAAADDHPEWGRTWTKDATVKPGCTSYSYSYALTPPEGDWALETFLIGPHGKQYGSGYFLTGKDPLAGDGTWRLCRRATRGGTYTIRARLTVQNGADYSDGWLPDMTFRLRKPHH